MRPRPFYPEAEWDIECLKKRTSVAQVKRRIEEGFDLFFNLCDGAADQNIPGIEVVHTLEAHGVPFTGASSGFYEPSREAMKAACRAQRIATPRYVFAENDAEVDRAASELAFPLIVKHHSSYASVDLSRRSRVRTLAGLKQQARKIIRRHGRALIEEFIEGAECTVLVAENPDDPARPRTYVPAALSVSRRRDVQARARQVDRLRPDVCRARRRSGIGRAASRRRRALFSPRSRARASAVATSASIGPVRRSCWRSTRTAACSTPRAIRAARISASRTMRKATPDSPAS